MVIRSGYIGSIVPGKQTLSTSVCENFFTIRAISINASVIKTIPAKWNKTLAMLSAVRVIHTNSKQGICFSDNRINQKGAYQKKEIRHKTGTKKSLDLFCVNYPNPCNLIDTINDEAKNKQSRVNIQRVFFFISAYNVY